MCTVHSLKFPKFQFFLCHWKGCALLGTNWHIEMHAISTAVLLNQSCHNWLNSPWHVHCISSLWCGRHNVLSLFHCLFSVTSHAFLTSIQRLHISSFFDCISFASYWCCRRSYCDYNRPTLLHSLYLMFDVILLHYYVSSLTFSVMWHLLCYFCAFNAVFQAVLLRSLLLNRYNTFLLFVLLLCFILSFYVHICKWSLCIYTTATTC